MGIITSRSSLSSHGLKYYQGSAIYNSSSTGTFTGALATNLGNFSITIGRTYILLLAYDPTGNQLPTISSIGNGQGVGTWSSLRALTGAPATTSSNTGVIIQGWILKATATNATNSITVNFSAAPSKGAWIFYEFSNLTTIQPNYTLTGSSTIGSAATTGSINHGKSYLGDLNLAFAGWEQNNAVFTNTGSNTTTGGTWYGATVANTPTGIATSGGASAANISICAQYKIATANSSQSSSLQNSATSNWAAQTFVIKAV